MTRRRSPLVHFTEAQRPPDLTPPSPTSGAPAQRAVAVTSRDAG
ncbi:hypothetical protein [Nonomuraea rubra]